MLRILMIGHHRRFKMEMRGGNMARYLVQRGHEVALMGIADHRRCTIHEEEWNGVRVIESPDLLYGKLRSGWDPWCTLNRSASLMFHTEQYDLIHALETRPATWFPSLFARGNRRIPIVTDWIDWWGRGGLIEAQRPWWYKHSFGHVETFFEEAYRSRGDGVTVISHALQERAEKLGIPSDRIEWIPGGASPEQFPDITQEEARRAEDLPLKSPLLLFAGLDVTFDLPIILESLKRILPRHPDTRLLATGLPAEQALLAAQRAGLKDGIVKATGFLPFDRYRRHLLAADIFLLPLSDTPANRGRWPNKIGDYLSAGHPTITNPVGEMLSLLRDHDIGLLTPPTEEGFAQAISSLLESPELRIQKGRNAYALSQGHLSWPRVAERLERFYLKTVERVRKSPDH